MNNILNKVKSDYILDYFTIEHLIILIVLVVFFIILLIVLLLVFSKISKNLKKKIENLNNLYHLRINLLNKTVHIFSNVNLRDAKTISLTDFINSFDKNNRMTLNRWLLDQLNPFNSEGNHLMINNYSKIYKSYVKDVFYCTNAFQEEHVIYVDHFISITGNKKNHESIYLKNNSQVERSFYKLKKSHTTVIGTLRFFPNDTKQKLFDFQLNPIHKQAIIDLILTHCDENHFITQYENDQIGIIILKYAVSRDHFLEKIHSEIKRKFALLGIDDKYTFHICTYQHYGKNINYNQIRSKLNNLSNYLLQSKDYECNIYYYDENNETRYKTKTEQEIRNQLINAINEKKFHLDITPFFKTKNASLFGYKIDLVANELELKNRNILNLTYYNSLQKEYILMYLSLISSLFKNTSTKPYIMIHLNYWMLQTVCELSREFRQVNNVIFLFSFSEESINTHYDYKKIAMLTHLKNSGFRIQVEISTCTNIRSDILEVANYYLIDSKLIDNAIKNDGFRIFLTNLIDDLNSRNKKIVGANIEDWATMETYIANGTRIVSGNCLECNNSTNAKINKRIASKIIETYNKYH